MFYERYLQLCEKAKITPSAAATKAGFNRGTVSVWKKKYEAGLDVTPDQDVVNKICNFFGCTEFWLRGIPVQKEKSHSNTGEGFDMDIYDRIQLLMDANNENAADLSRATGISTGLLSQWKSRMQVPSTQKLSLVAKHYNVTVNYLTSGSDDPTEPFGGLSKVFFSIAKDAQDNGIDPEDLQAMINLIKKKGTR